MAEQKQAGKPKLTTNGGMVWLAEHAKMAGLGI